MQNPNVSKITTIDPDTMAETVIFERKAGDKIIFRQNETLLKTGKWNEIINKLEKDGSKIRVSGSCKNPVLPTGNVYWTGTKGDSYWIPDDLYTTINIKTNPAGLSWAEIKNKYNISEVEFINGEPVFNEVSKGNVCITNFTSGGISVLKAGD